MPVVSPNTTIAYIPIMATGATAKNLQTGTTSAPATIGVTFPARTIFLRAPKANTAAVFIGDSTVLSTPAGNVMIDLQPGEGIFIDFNDLGTFWAVSAAAQSLFAVAMR